MSTSTPDCPSGELVARLREELRPVYSEAAQNVPGWEERAVAIATSIGDRVASLRIARSSLVSALRTVDRVLTQAVAVSVGTALQVAAVGTIVAMGVLSGFHEGGGLHDERALADALLAGRPVSGVISPLYTVISVRANGSSPTDVERAFSPDGVPALIGSVTSCSGHLLLPLAEEPAVDLCRRVHQELFGTVWLCLSERPVAEIPLACREVDDLLELVTSLGRPPGVYRITDVLFEYAAVATPEVSAELSRVVAPLLANPVLVETLTALMDADGNRALAVRRLFIHRSTIDYRLWQIEQLTGLSPVNPRDLAVLSTALAVCGRAPTGSGQR